MFFSFHHTKRQLNMVPMTITLAGYNHLQEPITRSKGLAIYQWFYCIDGIGEFLIQGRRCVLHPGNAVLICAQVPHSYRSLTPELHLNIIGFSGKLCYETLKLLRIHESGVYTFDQPDLFESYIKQVYALQEELQRTSRGRDHISSEMTLRLSKLCYSFLLDLSRSVHFVFSGEMDSGNETIREIITYMDDHYASPITLDDLAEHVHLSKGYMSTIFKKEMGQTPIQYLTKLRISQARVMLFEYPDRKVQEVGRLCGFESASYFGETFKKITGMTPEQFRIL